MKVLVCGDFTTCGRGREAIEMQNALCKGIIDIVKSVDVSIVNLEAPVSDSNDQKLVKHGPNLRTSISTISYLKSCGFTHVTLANNHFYDYCDAGVEKTINALIENNIGYVGAGRTLDELRKPLDLGAVVVLNYCEHEFSVHEPMGCNPLNPIQVFYDITKAKSTNKKVIVIVHGGHEGYNLPSPRMVELYRYFIDCGASVVVNHHQHCYSGWEEYKGGKIFYGLGNFFFDDFRPARHRNKIWNSGYMVELDTDIMGVRIIPYYQCLSKANVELMNMADSDVFFNDIDEKNAIIKNKNELNAHFDKFCKSQRKFRIAQLSPYSSRLLQAICRMGLIPSFVCKRKKISLWNVIRCESHRDVMLRSLRDE